MIRSLTTILFLFLFSFLHAEPLQPEIRHASHAMKYSDAESGIVFPSLIGPFKKTEVRRNLNPAIGTVIRYMTAEGSCADVNVYLYNCREEKPDTKMVQKHFLTLKRFIENMPSKNGTVSAYKRLETEENPVSGIFRLRFLITICGEKRFSEMNVLSFDKWIVKIRISSSSAVSQKKAESECNIFLDGIKTVFYRK